MITMATPFDEISVDWIERIESTIKTPAARRRTGHYCSAWRTYKPVVASTAGLDGQTLDQLVSLLEHQGLPFAIMHCVAIYPTPLNLLKLSQIDFLKTRFPGVPVGFSTHERPDAVAPIVAAVAKGATLFERHVGIATEKYKLNDYSSTPAQLEMWIGQWKLAVSMCGGARRSPAHQDELASLGSLKRGVFAKRPLQQGEDLTPEKVYFAMPWSEGQLDTSAWRRSLKADRAYGVDESISERLQGQESDAEEIIYQLCCRSAPCSTRRRSCSARTARSRSRTITGPSAFGSSARDRGLRESRVLQEADRVLPRQKHPTTITRRRKRRFSCSMEILKSRSMGNRQH